MNINTGEEIYDECNDYFNGYDIDKKPFQKKWVAVDDIRSILKQFRTNNYAGLSPIAHSDIIRLEKKLEDTEKVIKVRCFTRYSSIFPTRVKSHERKISSQTKIDSTRYSVKKRIKQLDRYRSIVYCINSCGGGISELFFPSTEGLFLLPISIAPVFTIGCESGKKIINGIKIVKSMVP